MVCQSKTNYLQKIFDTLIDSFLKDKVGIAEGFLTVALAADLKANLRALFEAKQLHFAATGTHSHALTDSAVRGDSIHWLDKRHNDPFEDAFFVLMDSFVAYLNSTCYTGITGYEFHYAIYQKGSFYKKHYDQFRSNDNRKYSMIMYLNTGWVKADGGELCIYHEDSVQFIPPESGKTVFFQSNELLHEVLETTTDRLSITGWLKVG